jgi:hypothetical protein
VEDQVSDLKDDNEAGTADENESELEKAAQGGQLPYVAEENEAAQRGEDQSDTADPDQKADEAGRGDVVGGINMR